MEIPEHENIERYATQCLHCTRKMLFTYENECDVFHVDTTVQNEKKNPLKFNGRKTHFINRLKCAERKRLDMFVLMYIEN